MAGVDEREGSIRSQDALVTLSAKSAEASQ